MPANFHGSSRKRSEYENSSSCATDIASDVGYDVDATTRSSCSCSSCADEVVKITQKKRKNSWYSPISSSLAFWTTSVPSSSSEWTSRQMSAPISPINNGRRRRKQSRREREYLVDRRSVLVGVLMLAYFVVLFVCFRVDLFQVHPQVRLVVSELRMKNVSNLTIFWETFKVVAAVFVKLGLDLGAVLSSRELWEKSWKVFVDILTVTRPVIN